MTPREIDALGFTNEVRDKFLWLPKKTTTGWRWLITVVERRMLAFHGRLISAFTSN